MISNHMEDRQVLILHHPILGPHLEMTRFGVTKNLISSHIFQIIGTPIYFILEVQFRTTQSKEVQSCEQMIMMLHSTPLHTTIIYDLRSMSLYVVALRPMQVTLPLGIPWNKHVCPGNSHQ